MLVNLGGDLATAGPAPDDGWRVRVTDDHRSGPEAPGQWITIAGGALATSSTAVRRWRNDEGETVHHLLDPATGRPASAGWRTVSVAAATCLDANIATTAAIVRGDRAPDWLRSLALPARLVSDQGLALHVAGWPEAGEDLEPMTGPLRRGSGVNLPLASIGPSAYWYLTRGTGAVSLALLTLSVVIGIAGSLRVSAQRWPRFAVDAVHRDVSLLAIALLVVHVITSVLDTFAPISITAAVIPFISSYRPFWLGLGALAFDLMLALAITSVLRRRLGYPAWRAVHWLAYVCWPVAVLHGLGTGTDTKIWWMLLLTAAVRGRRGGGGVCPPGPGRRTCPPAGGPRRSPCAWRRRWRWPCSRWRVRCATAGRAARERRPACWPTRRCRCRPTSQPVASRSTGPSSSPPRAFSATLDGSVRQAQIQAGAIVDLSMRLSGGARGRLRVRLGGAPIAGGGLSLTGSQVDLIANGLPVGDAGSDQPAGGRAVCGPRAGQRGHRHDPARRPAHRRQQQRGHR